MRKFKYRVWIPKYEILTDVIEINWESNKICIWDEETEHYEWYYFNEIELMQFTGLYDKTGKEIYEGDIVKASSQGVWGTFKVEWRQDGMPSWILYPAYQKGEFWKLHGTLRKDGKYYDNVEIIGDIYKNPDLVKS